LGRFGWLELIINIGIIAYFEINQAYNFLNLVIPSRKGIIFYIIQIETKCHPERSRRVSLI
tara:strand:+ start:4209 stop:4391 length:183 start_codon:yes stop_codon:yes gene_type:complete